MDALSYDFTSHGQEKGEDFFSKGMKVEKAYVVIQ